MSSKLSGIYRSPNEFNDSPRLYIDKSKPPTTIVKHETRLERFDRIYVAITVVFAVFIHD
jgi:hypothetical protein